MDGMFVDVFPSVVMISHTYSEITRDGPMLVSHPAGSGFVWNHDGIVVTNYSVIKYACQNPCDIRVTFFDGNVTTAHVVAFSQHKDLSILKINGEIANLAPIRVGTVSVHDLIVGQQVFVLGHPHGPYESLTVGVISGLNREIINNGFRTQECIQVNCTTNPGNSGGPLFDSLGRLIGIHTCMELLPNHGFPGIGYSLSIDTIRRVVGQLLEYGRIPPPGLGVEVAADDLIRPHGMDGLIVVDAPPFSAGGIAGLISTDISGNNIKCDIIRAVDGKPVSNRRDLYRIIDRHYVGDTVKVEFIRYLGGVEHQMEIEVVLQDMSS